MTRRTAVQLLLSAPFVEDMAWALVPPPAPKRVTLDYGDLEALEVVIRGRTYTIPVDDLVAALRSR